MVQQLRDLSSVFSTHQVTHNGLELQLQGIWHSLLASEDTCTLVCILSHKYKQLKITKIKKKFICNTLGAQISIKTFFPIIVYYGEKLVRICVSRNVSISFRFS